MERGRWQATRGIRIAAAAATEGRSSTWKGGSHSGAELPASIRRRTRARRPAAGSTSSISRTCLCDDRPVDAAFPRTSSYPSPRHFCFRHLASFVPDHFTVPVGIAGIIPISVVAVVARSRQQQRVALLFGQDAINGLRRRCRSAVISSSSCVCRRRPRLCMGPILTPKRPGPRRNRRDPSRDALAPAIAFRHVIDSSQVLNDASPRNPTASGTRSRTHPSHVRPPRSPTRPRPARRGRPRGRCARHRSPNASTSPACAGGQLQVRVEGKLRGGHTVCRGRAGTRVGKSRMDSS